MIALLLPIALAQSTPRAGLYVSDDLVAAWSGQTLVLRRTADPGAEGRTIELPAQPVDALEWQGALILLATTGDEQGLLRVDTAHDTWAPVEGLKDLRAMTVDEDTGALWVADADGLVTAIPLLLQSGGRWSVGKIARSTVGELEERVRRMDSAPDVGLIAAGDAGLTVLSVGAETQRIHSLLPHRVEDMALLAPGRIITLGMMDGHTVVTRWSLLHPEMPWPFPIGVTPLDCAPLGFIEVPGGVWAPCNRPLYEPAPIPGLIVGLPDPELHVLAAAAMLRGSPRAVLLLDDLSLITRPLPKPTRSGGGPLGDGAKLREGDWAGWVASLEPAEARTDSLARRLREDDLPLGLGMMPGGSLPEWARQAVEGFIHEASTFNRLPLVVARGYLDRFPSGNEDLRLELERRQEQLRARSAAAWGGLVLLGGGLTWLWRALRRRVALRERALAMGQNPFRQDSPNNPERTPFAANSLSDDLLHTLELNFAVVEGPQFSGKSALLRHVAWRLEHEGLGGREARVVSLDLFGVREERFWTVLGRAIAERFPEQAAAAEVLELDVLDRGAVEYLLDEALTDDGARLVLVLDDLDALGMYQREAQRFRGLLQVIPSHRLSVLGAGFNIRRGFAGTEDESPWFNLFQVRHLRPMSHEDLLRYLDSRLVQPFSFKPDVPPRLHALTEGRPLQVWHLCFAAVEAMLVERRLEMTVSHIEAAQNELRALAGVFSRSVGGDETLATDRQEAWEQVVRRVAEARRRRDELLQELRERRSAAQSTGMDDFFKSEL